MNNKLLINISILIILISITGCASIMEKTGQVLDGSAFKDKTISRYKTSNIEIFEVQNKNKERSLIISISDYPMMKLRASLPGEDGVFMITSLEYLAGTTHGWNEYTMELLGEGTLSFNNGAHLGVLEFEKIQISNGRIHRYDTRITGNEALTSLRNRKERISAIVEWMHSSEEAPKGQITLKHFEEYWKPILFPEMVKNKKRPAGWKQNDDVFQRADSIRWNTGYTQRVFSEELLPVRNSATMLRDWEEALPWIYMEYNWDYIIGIFTNDIILTKIK